MKELLQSVSLGSAKKLSEEKLQNQPKPNKIVSNFFSQIFHQEDEQSLTKHLNPEYLRVKNNILLLLLVLTAFAIYHLFADFMDTIILAFICGLTYQQVSIRFVRIALQEQDLEWHKMTRIQRIWKVFLEVIVLLLLPWLRHLFKHPQKLHQLLEITQIWESNCKSANFTIRISQVIILMRIIYYLFGRKIKKLYLAPLEFFAWIFNKVFNVDRFTYKKFILKLVFALLTFISIMLFVVVVPTILFKETAQIGQSCQKLFEENFGCQLLPIINGSQHPMCSQKISSLNNTYIQQFLETFKFQNSTMIPPCVAYIKSVQAQFINPDWFQYEETVCMWIPILQKASRYIFNDKNDMISAGKNIFTIVFGNLAYFLYSLSNAFFSFTTFIAIFIVTVNLFNPKSSVFLQIIYGQKKQLIEQITILIQGTFIIMAKHFFFSVCLLEIFGFSQLNLMLASFLSVIAFVPIIKPYFFVIIFSIVKALFQGYWIIWVVFAFIYMFISSSIYESSYGKIEFHQIITSMSVLFGIYQFGVVGIFYGPLLIILFKYVHNQLFKNKVYLQNTDNER